MTEHRRGLWFGLGAYLGWGFFPLYWPLLKPAGATEILAHRVVWSLLFVVVLVLAMSRLALLRAIASDRRRLGFISIGAVVVAINWGTYIWGVNHDHVVETSLGYFINPLVTVFLGVLVLGERLRRVQWAAITIAVLAVLVLTYDYGRPPWIALVLAFSFGTYGLMKKQAGVGTTEGLTIETAILAPVALAYLLVGQTRGVATFGHEGWGHVALLVGTGVVTAIPLLLFGASATRIPMTTLGMLQYVTPLMQFAIGLLVFDESMTLAGWLGFGLVWLALLVLTAESLHRRRVPAPTPMDSEPAPASA
ncbi:MAG: EamA family transporter RarD [Nocardioidaceae bacterium]